MIERGSVWWADLRPPSGTEPGWRRPVVVVSDDAYNASRIATVTVVTISSNLRLADAPGNVALDRGEAGLPKASVINVSQVVTIDKGALSDELGRLDLARQRALDDGLLLALGLPA